MDLVINGSVLGVMEPPVCSQLLDLIARLDLFSGPVEVPVHVIASPVQFPLSGLCSVMSGSCGKLGGVDTIVSVVLMMALVHSLGESVVMTSIMTVGGVSVVDRDVVSVPLVLLESGRLQVDISSGSGSDLPIRMVLISMRESSSTILFDSAVHVLVVTPGLLDL